MKRFFVAFVSFVLALGAGELFLHLRPRALPRKLRKDYTAFGIEFFRPGVLARTPLEALPMPLVRDPHGGRPLADLVERGFAPESAAAVGASPERFAIPVDELGLPNAETVQGADVVTVGDSFLVAAASTEPPGLLEGMRRQTGERVYNLALPGLGPDREAWLLEHVGLPLGPELVLWFFFGGNDLVDAMTMIELELEGVETYADLPSYEPPPRLRLPALVGFLARREERAGREPLPPWRLSFGAERTELWLLPTYLLRCEVGGEAWSRHPGWGRFARLLARSRQRSEEVGARLALVYVPSKSQVLLPYVERDEALLGRVLEAEGRSVDSVAQTYDRLLASRGALEELVRDHCDEEGIPFFSVTPHLEALAERGELGFFPADTHWSPRGQEAVLPPLLAFLEERGLLLER